MWSIGTVGRTNSQWPKSETGLRQWWGPSAWSRLSPSASSEPHESFGSCSARWGPHTAIPRWIVLKISVVSGSSSLTWRKSSVLLTESSRGGKYVGTVTMSRTRSSRDTGRGTSWLSAIAGSSRSNFAPPQQQSWADAVEAADNRLNLTLKDGVGPASMVAYFALAAKQLRARELGHTVDHDTIASFQQAREQVVHEGFYSD